jgi:DNA repair exonuclease SbcCD ATPase subunit
MPDDTITLVSTTDSAEEVQAALTNKPVEKPAEKPAETDEAGEKQAAPPAETPEQEAERESREEASEAGSALAKRRAKIQAAIDKDIQRKTAARLDAEAEEARVNELRRQREELEAAMPQREAQKADAPPATPDGPLGRPEPVLDAVDDKGNAKYANYEAYLSDHAVWTKEEAILAVRKEVEQKELADRARIERDSTNRVVNERLAAYNANLETFKKTHADFDAAVEDAREEVQATLIGLGKDAMKVIDGYTIFDAKDGPALTYYLLKHPDELKGIAALPPPQQLVKLARLEERITPTPAGAKKNGPSAVAAETKAPEPIRPVGSGPTATTVPLDEESFQDYKARRARELRAKQGL